MQLPSVFRCALAVGLVWVLAVGCDTDAQVDQFQYYCDADEECGQGFDCYSPPQGRSYCVPDGATPDGGAQDTDPEPDTGSDTDLADADELDTAADVGEPDADVDADAGQPDADADPSPEDVISLHLDGAINLITNLIVAPDGDFVVTGVYAHGLEVGGASITPAGTRDGFALRVSPRGQVRWLRSVGSPNEIATLGDIPYAAAYDTNDQLLLGGSTLNGLKYGGENVISGTNPADANVQAYVLSADDGGLLDWSHVFGTAENEASVEGDGVTSIAALTSGHTIIGGMFEGCLHELPQDDLGAPCPNQASGPVDGFLIGLDASGAEAWRTVLTNDDHAKVTHAASGAGRLVFAAEFDDTVAVRGNSVTPADQGRNRLIGELDDSGSSIWHYAPATNANLVISSLAYGAGGMLLAGSFNRDVSFGGASPSRTGITADGFVAQLDASGELDWIAQLSGTSSGLNVPGMQVDGQDRVVVALRYRQEADFKTANLQGEDGLDAAVAVLSAQGQLIWSENLAGPGPIAISHAAASQGRAAAVIDFDRSFEFRDTQVSEPAGGTHLLLFDEPNAD